ncbi:NAD(+) synthase [Steroidobacter sp. S1-65]|uniref:NH(3)-dependent NAD(+) synthetase n=1 Tax=Steroidobacter gossypii TaxID=2805490 RepID=A0ABS1WZ06_9GAMM|nr:NAD(+) synthase [Steroidobacter gossypii]MBM0106206.1 NAD(+) synthase [Steroidobacter gossypii]
MAARKPLDASVLEMDNDRVIETITTRLRSILAKDVGRRGFVCAMSGGIDSSVSSALCVKALGKDKVYGLMLPERDSSGFSTARGRQLAEHLGIRYEVFDIAPALEGIGCYQWRDEAIRKVFPEYGEGWKNKIVISGGLEGQINHFQLVVQSPQGETRQARLPLPEYLQIVAATNHKQRIRKTVEYFHADRLNYAVIGTPNRLEYDQGFFVKNGDGSADVKPIAHLYKTQVYALARHMQLPKEICEAIPTTDTYSLAQGQDEFYFALPYQQMDIALYALNHGYSSEELAAAINITPQQAANVYRDIEAKRRATRYMHLRPQLVEPVNEIKV